MTDYLQQTKQYQVLLVEDDPANLHIITSCLGDDYHLVIAKTRKKALELLKDKPIDICLLDINLPDGNGFEICTHIRSKRNIYGDLVIIFMTGLDSAGDESTGLRLGANDYIHKPINCLVLKARVDLQCELIRKTRLLSQVVNIDSLTEIPNRRALDDRLENEWNRAKRDKVPISLALLDIDYFKQFNDTYGHPAGDLCLKKLAWTLGQSFQRSSDFYARYGGEEFAVILSGAESLGAINKLKQTLRLFSEHNIPHSDSKVANIVTFSAGVSTASPAAEEIELFLSSADKLLYQAKEQGRNQICGGLLKDTVALESS